MWIAVEGSVPACHLAFATTSTQLAKCNCVCQAKCRTQQSCTKQQDGNHLITSVSFKVATFRCPVEVAEADACPWHDERSLQFVWLLMPAQKHNKEFDICACDVTMQKCVGEI